MCVCQRKVEREAHVCARIIPVALKSDRAEGRERVKGGGEGGG